jgi:3-dehydroquinate dehydratase-2
VSNLVYVLNGPNLNLLGEREPKLYGYDTLDSIRQRCVEAAAAHGWAIDFRQTNFEGELVESIHEARKRAAAIVINPAGLSFYSVPILDALKTFDGPKVEVHITNIHQRESPYNRSLLSGAVTGVICGLGAHGYELALAAVIRCVQAA